MKRGPLSPQRSSIRGAALRVRDAVVRVAEVARHPPRRRQPGPAEELVEEGGEASREAARARPIQPGGGVARAETGTPHRQRRQRGMPAAESSQDGGGGGEEAARREQEDEARDSARQPEQRRGKQQRGSRQLRVHRAEPRASGALQRRRAAVEEHRQLQRVVEAEGERRLGSVQALSRWCPGTWERRVTERRQRDQRRVGADGRRWRAEARVEPAQRGRQHAQRRHRQQRAPVQRFLHTSLIDHCAASPSPPPPRARGGAEDREEHTRHRDRRRGSQRSLEPTSTQRRAEQRVSAWRPLLPVFERGEGGGEWQHVQRRRESERACKDGGEWWTTESCAAASARGRARPTARAGRRSEASALRPPPCLPSRTRSSSRARCRGRRTKPPARRATGAGPGRAPAGSCEKVARRFRGSSAFARRDVPEVCPS